MKITCRLGNALDDKFPFPNGEARLALFFSGVRVFSSMDDDWVVTRRVWKQHAYSLTNIEENGSSTTSVRTSSRASSSPPPTRWAASTEQ